MIGGIVSSLDQCIGQTKRRKMKSERGKVERVGRNIG